MTDVRTLFMSWANAELAMHYAQPCPDEVMNHLSDQMSNAMKALAEAPAQSAEEIYLKMFPALLYEYEPKQGDMPLIPQPASALHVDHGMIASILLDISRLCPDIAAVLNAPHYSVRRAAA